jgi:opacity protein-like surface antigen
MKKLAIAIAAVAICTQTAMAEDFDNTSLSVAATGAQGGVELSTNETSRSLKLSSATTNFPVQWSLKFTDNTNGNDDWELGVNRKFEMPRGEGETLSIYADPKLAYSFGDSYTNNELSLTPTLGVSTQVGSASPYAELGVGLKATDADYFDWSRSSTSLNLGVVVPVNANMDIDVGVTRSMDSDFGNASHQAGVKFVLKY